MTDIYPRAYDMEVRKVMTNSKRQMINAVKAQKEAILAKMREEADERILACAAEPPVNSRGSEHRSYYAVISRVTEQIEESWGDVPSINCNDIIEVVNQAFDSLAYDWYIYTDSKHKVFLTPDSLPKRHKIWTMGETRPVRKAIAARAHSAKEEDNVPY
jgi:hypothetical protein